MRVMNKRIWPNQYVLPYTSGDYSKEWQWCSENVPRNLWFSFTSGNRLIFAFKDISDMIAFKLMWAN